MQALRIDHAHIEVADRDTAAAWYEAALGLKRASEFEDWASDPMDPLILVGGDGHPTLSLFARACAAPSRDTTIAFRVSGQDFLSFRNTAEKRDLRDGSGAVITQPDIEDHDISWSIYVSDPDQNRIEITTYDYDLVGHAL